MKKNMRPADHHPSVGVGNGGYGRAGRRGRRPLRRVRTRNGGRPMAAPTGYRLTKADNQKAEKAPAFAGALLVELRGVEPLSENNLTRTSPGAVCYLHSLGGTGTNTLTALVASLFMARAKLTARTVPTESHPSPARGPSGADGSLIKQRPERDYRCQLI